MNTLKNAKARFENTLMLRMGGVRPDHSDSKNNLKKEAGDHLLEVLGVIIIAVIILVFFRKEIIALFEGAIGKTVASVNNLFDPIGTSSTTTP